MAHCVGAMKVLTPKGLQTPFAMSTRRVHPHAKLASSSIPPYKTSCGIILIIKQIGCTASLFTMPGLTARTPPYDDCRNAWPPLSGFDNSPFSPLHNQGITFPLDHTLLFFLSIRADTEPLCRPSGKRLAK
jgi:hypothetical protein